MHTLIVGITESGKSTIAKMMCAEFKRTGTKTAVLDPLFSPDWECDFITGDSEAYLDYLKKNKSVCAFIDEAGKMVGRYNVEMEWLVTQSRHWGHSAFLITQGVTQLNPVVRTQCTRKIIFGCGEKETRLLAEESRRPELKSLGHIPQGVFYSLSNFGDVTMGRVDFAKKRIYEYSEKELDKPKKDDLISEDDKIVNEDTD